MTWFNDNWNWLAPIVGVLGANSITPIVRKIPDVNMGLKILRALLSGVPSEAKKPQ